jgi:hypothetical protein
MQWLRIGGIVGIVGFGLIITAQPRRQKTSGVKHPISRLTLILTRSVDRPVLDLTGLVQNDLGPRLEARNHPVEVQMINHVERTPKEN